MPSALSFDGSTAVGGVSGRSPYRVWRVRAGSFEWLPNVPGGFLGGSPVGVSSDGEVIAGRAQAAGGGMVPTIWTGNTSVATPGPPDYWALTRAISNDGSVVIGGIPAANAFIIRSGQMQVYTSPPGMTLGSVSADGTIASGTAVRSGSSEPILVANGEVRWLRDELDAHGVSTAGWAFSANPLVSRDGTTFVGNGTFNNVPQAWRAVLPR
jgi:uncharacterized membrane protein